MTSLGCFGAPHQWRTQKNSHGGFHSVVYGGHLYLMSAICDVIV